MIDRGSCSHGKHCGCSKYGCFHIPNFFYLIRPYITHHWPVNICLKGDLNLCSLINSNWSGLTCMQAKPKNLTKKFLKDLHWLTGNSALFLFPVAQVSHRWGLNRLEEILSAFLCFFWLIFLLNQTESRKEWRGSKKGVKTKNGSPPQPKALLETRMHYWWWDKAKHLFIIEMSGS